MLSATGDLENTARLGTRPKLSHPFDHAFVSTPAYRRMNKSLLTCCEVEGVVAGVDGGRRSEDEMRTETRVQLLKS